MFGLEGDKKKDAEFVFDLEQEAKDLGRYRELIETIEKRSQEIKEILRKGVEKEDYNTFGVLLHGYAALLRVLGRINKK